MHAEIHTGQQVNLLLLSNFNRSGFINSIQFYHIKFPKNQFIGSFMCACGEMNREDLIGALQAQEHT
jgi:hypothetical protein